MAAGQVMQVLKNFGPYDSPICLLDNQTKVVLEPTWQNDHPHHGIGSRRARYCAPLCQLRLAKLGVSTHCRTLQGQGMLQAQLRWPFNHHCRWAQLRTIHVE
jgi:hypothetical protein